MNKLKTKGGFNDGFMSKHIDTIELIKCIIKNKAEKLAFDLYLKEKPTKDEISKYINDKIVPYIDIIYENFLKCIKILSDNYSYTKYDYEKKQGRSFTQLGYLINYLNNKDNNINFGNYNNEAYILYCIDNPFELFRNKCYFNNLLLKSYLSLQNPNINEKIVITNEDKLKKYTYDDIFKKIGYDIAIYLFLFTKNNFFEDFKGFSPNTKKIIEETLIESFTKELIRLIGPKKNNNDETDYISFDKTDKNYLKERKNSKLTDEEIKYYMYKYKISNFEKCNDYFIKAIFSNNLENIKLSSKSSERTARNKLGTTNKQTSSIKQLLISRSSQYLNKQMKNKFKFLLHSKSSGRTARNKLGAINQQSLISRSSQYVNKKMKNMVKSLLHSKSLRKLNEIKISLYKLFYEILTDDKKLGVIQQSVIENFQQVFEFLPTDIQDKLIIMYKFTFDKDTKITSLEMKAIYNNLIKIKILLNQLSKKRLNLNEWYMLAVTLYAFINLTKILINKIKKIFETTNISNEIQLIINKIKMMFNKILKLFYKILKKISELINYNQKKINLSILKKIVVKQPSKKTNLSPIKEEDESSKEKSNEDEDKQDYSIMVLPLNNKKVSKKSISMRGELKINTNISLSDIKKILNTLSELKVYYDINMQKLFIPTSECAKIFGKHYLNSKMQIIISKILIQILINQIAKRFSQESKLIDDFRKFDELFKKQLLIVDENIDNSNKMEKEIVFSELKLSIENKDTVSLIDTNDKLMKYADNFIKTSKKLTETQKSEFYDFLLAERNLIQQFLNMEMKQGTEQILSKRRNMLSDYDGVLFSFKQKLNKEEILKKDVKENLELEENTIKIGYTLEKAVNRLSLIKKSSIFIPDNYIYKKQLDKFVNEKMRSQSSALSWFNSYQKTVSVPKSTKSASSLFLNSKNMMNSTMNFLKNEGRILLTRGKR